jgi:hypothetical protein
MIERLNNIKRNAKGDGRSSCVLCNEEFGLFGAQCHLCKDCLKVNNASFIKFRTVCLTCNLNII